MTALNAANLLEAFFEESSNRSRYDSRVILLALGEIDGHIDLWESQGSNVVPFRKAVAVWRTEVFHLMDRDTGVFRNNLAPSGNLREGDLGVLSWAAERIASTVPETNEESREGIRQMVQGVRNLLVEDRTIPDRLRVHVARLLHHVEEALETYDITGEFLLEDAVERLLGALNLVENASEDPTKWQKFRADFLPGFASQLAASGVFQGMLAITASITGSAG